MVESAECWIDVFELPQFRGRRRRLFGPASYPELRSRLPGWGISIDSAIVGPAAYVRLHGEANSRSARWLLPRQVVADLRALGVNDELDCMEIRDMPPTAADAGYESFKAAIAHQ